MSLSELSQLEALKIQRGIRQAEDELVKAVQKALDDKASNELEESQFRNLVRVADTTESIEVIKNFLRYQVGRDKKWGRGKDSLAEHIINDIETQLRDEADKIAKSVNVDQSNAVLLELTRRYLGYGARHLVYKRKDQSKDKSEE